MDIAEMREKNKELIDKNYSHLVDMLNGFAHKFELDLFACTFSADLQCNLADRFSDDLVALAEICNRSYAFNRYDDFFLYDGEDSMQLWSCNDEVQFKRDILNIILNMVYLSYDKKPMLNYYEEYYRWIMNQPE